jgi:hypothetical protein
MFRIDTAGALASLPTVQPLGSLSGYFTAGNPGAGQPATIVSADWLNAVQEELMAIIAAAGIAPDKTNPNQVIAALRSLFRGSAMQVFTSSGTFTVPAGVTKVRSTVVGAGSGANGCNASQAAGANGGGGGWSIGTFSVTPGQSIPVTVGLGGAGSVAGVTSGAGGTSSFGSFNSATGGQSAANSNAFNGGAPGTGTGGQINGSGSYGSDGSPTATGAYWPGLSGGSLFGGAARSGISGGFAGQAPGAGGSSPYWPTSAVTVSGAAGANGIVILEF